MKFVPLQVECVLCHVQRTGFNPFLNVSFCPLMLIAYSCQNWFFPLSGLPKWALNWHCHTKYGVQSITEREMREKKRCHYLIRFKETWSNDSRLNPADVIKRHSPLHKRFRRRLTQFLERQIPLPFKKSINNCRKQPKKWTRYFRRTKNVQLL